MSQRIHTCDTPSTWKACAVEACAEMEPTATRVPAAAPACARHGQHACRERKGSPPHSETLRHSP
jgi:hypothetical protein